MKQISLSKGYVALVDDEDYEWLMQYNWFVSVIENRDTYYALTAMPEDRTKQLRMHRLILGVVKGQYVDHRDGNGLNNQRSNLRICTLSDNNRHRRKTTYATTSKYKGVHWEPDRRKWRASIVIEGKGKNLGRFNTEEEAAIVYNKAAKEYFGEFALLNRVGEEGVKTYKP